VAELQPTGLTPKQEAEVGRLLFNVMGRVITLEDAEKMATSEEVRKAVEYLRGLQLIFDAGSAMSVLAQVRILGT